MQKEEKTILSVGHRSYITIIKKLSGSLVVPVTTYSFIIVIWASRQQNLSSGFPTKRVSNQPLQLQKLARKLKFHS